MLLLNAGDHDTDTDPWPWGGEPIFRDGIYAGRVTTTAYGFSLNRHVCLGFVHDYDECGPEGCKFPPEGSVTNTITPDWVKVFKIATCSPNNRFCPNSYHLNHNFYQN